MAYKSLREFIDTLEKAGELIRIKEYVNPELDIAEITDRISKTPDRNKALLFENTGTEFPLLINSMGSEKRMCIALGVNHLDDSMHEIEDLFKMMSAPKNGILEKLAMLPQLGKFASWMPKVVKGKGACQEVIMADPDLSKIPILKCWPEDGGPFITLPAIHTKDPNNGIRNIGMYRMQVFEKNMTGMHWHKHKVSARHYNEYKKLGKRMPVAVALGGDPVYTYAATAPLPENVDEYMLAGFLRKKKVELVKCITQPDIEVPADADFIIEGYVDTDEELIWEGPFGDHTGYYSLPDWYPRFHVTAITHRKGAVYPATIVGIPPQEDAWIGKATERIFLAPIKMTMVPEITDMNMPVEGVFHNLVIATINKEYAGQGQKVMNAMWGAGQMMFNKILVLADGKVKIDDYLPLAQYVFNNLNPVTDVYFSQGPMDVLDHSCSKLGFGGKMCIDGTKKWEEEMTEPLVPFKLNTAFSKEAILAALPELASLNDNLARKYDLPILFVSIKKDRPGHVRAVHDAICKMNGVEGIKMILYVEQMVSADDVTDVLWRFCNNLDPRRDHFFGGANNNILGLDGTRKTKALDNFDRPWPNIIAADEATIRSVDEKWSSLGLGKLIISPSLKYSTQLYRGGAAVLDSE
ncbi:menaquinone biosynthesis decarboxylase [Flavipsychrobacter stenotrophus]|uniref:Menaquinone biosynthesis decarboxylase n=1 Tax=Flavipsychrobacter stenotrophus TaxID=2077091 RepID=A0A2S7SUH4_9BACT|nr:menaquinone biosynthesis decarboxylase [Flavipsychrobacter stenotrophus]PQJ10569.1 menaquinone biosynthesis decarboxylase [Flavipsychrobacter stenotrophus]